MNQERLNTLLQKHRDQTASEKEEQELLNWYREKAYQDAEFPESESDVNDFMFSRLIRGLHPKKESKPNLKWLIAASVLLISAVSLFFYLKGSDHTSPGNIVLKEKNDAAPGSNKALLTLADGSTITLTDSLNGEIASENGIRISKAANGQLVYTVKANSPEKNIAAAINTIETPKGGQFQIVLPDGSKVWLNAVSSIKFPVNFKQEKTRWVELKGEAYFEVKHNKELPFKVITDKQVVEVLGTHFNVNAYETAIKTCLLEGKVRLTADNNSVLLNPGQQAILANGISVSKVNTDAVIAWKNGYFNFDDEKLETIMKSVERWYNVEVIYQDEALKNETFGAVTTRFSNVSALLKIMEQLGDVHFDIEGSTIHISRKK